MSVLGNKGNSVYGIILKMSESGEYIYTAAARLIFIPQKKAQVFVYHGYVISRDLGFVCFNRLIR